MQQTFLKNKQPTGCTQKLYSMPRPRVLTAATFEIIMQAVTLRKLFPTSNVNTNLTTYRMHIM